MKKLFLLMAVMLGAVCARAQVTTDPSPLYGDSQGVTVYFNAAEGNKGLMGLPADTHIYAHTGVQVITASGATVDWKYAPSWDEDNPKYQLENVGPDLWKLYIGDIRTFYGVAQDETVKKLCFVFRNSGGTLEGKTATGGDIFVDVINTGLELTLRSGILATVITEPTSINFTAMTNEPADIKLYANDVQFGEGTGIKTLRAAYNFQTQGNYEIKAVATASGQTVTRTLTIVYTKVSEPAADTSLPPMGVTKNSDNTYSFCVAAPQKSTVMLVGSWNGYAPATEQVMEYVDKMIDGTAFRHFKITLPASTTGTEFGYYYLVDGVTSVADPYSVLVLDPYNDKYINPTVYPNLPAYPEGKVPNNTVVTWYGDNLLAYDWNVTDFKGASKDNLIIYEMLFRDFTGTEGKAAGNGTVRQAMGKLNYLKQLGINAVELLPINEFNGNNSWGYNPNFYLAVDKAYGTPQDYKEFIDACHGLGIAVILDIVFNQSDGLHPWYQMYGGVKDSPFYNWGLGGENGAPHAYSVLNDWNQGYPLVEQHWYDVVKFWMSEYKVDGFRFDLVKGLGDNTSYRNATESATEAYNESRVARMKRIHDAMREVNPDAYFINENLAGVQEENEMAADGELNWYIVNDPGCQFAMAYQSNAGMNTMWAPRSGRTAGSTVSFLESHDEQRLGYKQITWGVAGVKDNHVNAMHRLGSAAAQMILVPGSHMIWMFSEMGNSQNTKNDNGGNNTSPKIVNWNLLDDPDNYGLMHNYAELINIRLNNQDLFAADAEYGLNLGVWEPSPRYITSRTPQKELYAVINSSVTQPVTYNVTFRSNNNADYTILSKSYNSNPTFDAASGTITVPANCYAVVTTTNVTGVEGTIADLECRTSIYPVAGAICVSGNEGAVDVFALDGAKVASAKGDAMIPVAPGLYVVRAGAKTVKVLVK